LSEKFWKRAKTKLRAKRYDDFPAFCKTIDSIVACGDVKDKSDPKLKKYSGEVKMKRTNFAVYLNKYFTDYLPNACGSSSQTIDSYRYSFIHFLQFLSEERGIAADKADLSNLSYDNVAAFLGWLENSRGNGVSTRNQRQSALNSFIRFLMCDFPEHLDEYQRVLAIPIKKAPQKEISYLKTDGAALLISKVGIDKTNGLRDCVMLSLMRATGIRVSELIRIKVKDLSLHKPYALLIHGKGQKSRYVPLMKKMVPQIRRYLGQKGYDKPEKLNEWLFKNHMNEQFTRQGVNYLIKKYAQMARMDNPEIIPEDFSPRKMRHTAAMELVESGVDLIYIRDLLGHVSLNTTKTYARADAQKKRQEIEAAGKEIAPPEDAARKRDSNLKDWLKNFNRR
jgi:site-specific recombinase XerD